MTGKIRHEREIELCFEAHRAFDIRRWMIANTTENLPLGGVSVTRNPDGSFTYQWIAVQQKSFRPAFYLWPINRTEMRRNPLLTQNPGYN